MKQKDHALLFDAMSRAHIPTPHDYLGDPPGYNEDIPKEVLGDFDKLVELLGDPSIEYYSKVIETLEEHFLGWMEKIHARSTEGKRYQFMLTQTFVTAWMSHAFGGGVSFFVLKDDAGKINACALIHLETSLLSGYQRLGVIGYAGDTPELEEELVERIVELAGHYKNMLGNSSFQVSLPLEAQADNEVRREIIEV